MPTNLNALIRFKTIDNCLHGGRGRSIYDLIEKCSDALAEYRGRNELISERTIRSDIHFLRSELFNAPIEVKEGLYFYSDPHFSIFNLKITSMAVANKLYKTNKKHFESLSIDKISVDDKISDIRFSLNEREESYASETIDSKSVKLKDINQSAEVVDFTKYVNLSNLTWGEIIGILTESVTKKRH
jgi:hypothetical protein